MKIENKLTWKQVMPVLIEALKSGAPRQKHAASEELMRLASEVDAINGTTIVKEEEKKPRKKHVHMRKCDICGRKCRGLKGINVHKSLKHGIHAPDYEVNKRWRIEHGYQQAKADEVEQYQRTGEVPVTHG